MKQRERKFRAYDKKFDKMYYSHEDGASHQELRVSLWKGSWEIDICDENENQIGDVGIDGKDYILMEYSGLLDRDGNEICEGDKVDYKGLVMVIEFRCGVFGYESGSCVGDFISLGLNYYYDWDNNKSSIIKIIGNIYE